MTLDEVIKELEVLRKEAEKKMMTAAHGCDDLYYQGKEFAYGKAIYMLSKLKDGANGGCN